MQIPRFLTGLYSLFAAVAASIAALCAALFAIPGDILARVRMSVADHAAKLGRDLKARRLMFALSLWQSDPGPAAA